MSPSLSQAARDAGVGLTTLHRWLDAPDFRDELTRLRQEASDLARVELQGLILRGVTVIGEAMEHPDPAIRLRAARYALAFGNNFFQLQKLGLDLAELQQVLYR